MFEDRKSVFVDLLKWDVPVLDGRFELDEFDDEHATYVIIADKGGDHLGSARLLPTTRRHILGSLFPESVRCAAAERTGRVRDHPLLPLAAPGRAGPARDPQPAGQRAGRCTRSRPASALIPGVAEIAWLQQILAFGWDCRPLGVPAQDQCGMLGALAIEITPDTPRLLAANGIWEPSATRHVSGSRRLPDMETANMADLAARARAPSRTLDQAPAGARLVRDPQCGLARS